MANTEFGMDYVAPEFLQEVYGYTPGPWKDMAVPWKQLDGENDKADYYVRQILNFADRQFQYDKWHMGAAIFLWGSGNHDWDRFEIEGTVADKLVTEMQRMQTFTGVHTVSDTGQWMRRLPGYDQEAVGIIHSNEVYPTLDVRDGWFLDSEGRCARLGRWTVR